MTAGPTSPSGGHSPAEVGSRGPRPPDTTGPSSSPGRAPTPATQARPRVQTTRRNRRRRGSRAGTRRLRAPGLTSRNASCLPCCPRRPASDIQNPLQPREQARTTPLSIGHPTTRRAQAGVRAGGFTSHFRHPPRLRSQWRRRTPLAGAHPGRPRWRLLAREAVCNQCAIARACCIRTGREATSGCAMGRHSHLPMRSRTPRRAESAQNGTIGESVSDPSSSATTMCRWCVCACKPHCPLFPISHHLFET